MTPEAIDNYYMARAIELARSGWYTTMPNPRVGCVIVDVNSHIIGKGWHERAGEPHAEVHALRMAGTRAKGATAYVTLEPCSHFGRTPPCAEALKAAGVARVVAAVKDVNPAVAGKGMAILQEAGVETRSGVLEEEAKALNEGFFKRMSSGLPLVRAKLAMSLDGRTAMASGESQWITGPAARSEVQKLRAQSCAIITGVGSILKDNASLTVRPGELGLANAEDICKRQPLRVVLDSTLKTPIGAKVISGLGQCLIVTTSQHSPEKKAQLEQAGAEVLILENTDNNTDDKVDLKAVLKELGRRECNEVLLETGAQLAGSMISENLIDELIVFMAPVLMGSEARPLFNLPLHSMSEKKELIIKDIRAVGDDWKITARPISQAS
ncbi:bifunctional diaminohydroxyphosphoribosylaminopyrimidine deaminase/5-amino-6-(5-phosphoribosylamino)uracil reductase RibD [Endozoicomonas elysicola]|uniref:Riboflavin biosynthesis protein RibD n=1 Tax=Endozoicomonas elysicola TaxID=305900 RepID=A0A081K878_9GAMM|nr:bifunctional diaminohydroxyphosphoribosylaminopyrimidine deaminase/5-amino-6-(5-phosphoribosylamino)uracil reductase RibD [Endozoicomonas elysicola]KEI70354.1 riboflavin biosynthesis protein RibD [Endozoicomonas elysicola]